VLSFQGYVCFPRKQEKIEEIKRKFTYIFDV